MLTPRRLSHFPVPRARSADEGGKDCVDLAPARVGELARAPHACIPGDAGDRVPREALNVTDVLGDRALARPPRREVVLERNLDDDPAGDPRRFGEHRDRIGDVLEHVREHSEIERPGLVRERLRVVRADVSIRTAPPSQRDRRVGDLDSGELPITLAASEGR